MAARKRKILIVDDDHFLIDMYSLKFKEAGYDVDTAEGGKVALEKLAHKSALPDVVLLDLIMPGVGGMEVLKEVKEKNLSPGSIFIVLSNQGQAADIARAKELGADHYIVKASAVPSEVLVEVEKKLAESKP